MNIYHFLHEDMRNPWYGGGPSRRAHEIYRRMVDKHRITFITSYYSGAKRFETIDGIDYIRIGIGKTPVLSLISYSVALLFYRSKDNIDIIVKDFSPYSPSFTPLLKKTPTIICFQQNPDHQFLKAYGILGIVPFVFHKISLNFFDNYILTSPSIFELYKRVIKHKDNMRMFPYGVDDDLLKAKTDEKPYILFLGRLDIYQKGLDILIEAFRLVASENKEISLYFVGQGRQDDKVKELVKSKGLDSRVKFLGRLHGKERIEVLANCLFLCCPSRMEGWSLVGMEAAAVGKAVVGSNIPGIWDVVQNDGTGILVEPENSVELANAILDLIADQGKRKKFGKTAKEWVRNCTWDKLARNQECFFEETIKLNGA